MFRIGHGTDVHRLVNNRKFILGGIEIPSDVGLDGHSDADALTHAIMDSILGALGEPDIGHFFPPSDIKWKDASSIEMLKIVVSKMKEKKASLVNLDCCVHLEAPKILKFAPQMKEKLAEILEVKPEAVGIKATTFEGLGTIGRNEGIFVSCVALLALSH